MTPNRPPVSSQTVEDSAEPGTLPRGPGSARIFVRRPMRVDAMRVTDSNAAEVAEWFGEGASVLGNAVRVPIEAAADRWIVCAKPGMWVCVDETGGVQVLTEVECARLLKAVRP